MHAPLYSTITLFAELLVSSAIYYTLYQGFKHGKFSAKIAGAALLYEIIFNISYMTSQAAEHVKIAKISSPMIISLAIVHGVLSLIMFIALIVFFVLAWRKYSKGINFFKKHTVLTRVFLVFWTFSVLSGILFYLVIYIL